MKEEVTIYYSDDTEEVLKPEGFDYLVGHNEETKETTVTICTDFEDNKISGIGVTLTKTQWFEIVKGAQEVIDAWEEEDEIQ